MCRVRIYGVEVYKFPTRLMQNRGKARLAGINLTNLKRDTWCLLEELPNLEDEVDGSGCITIYHDKVLH
jgi:hypothetical protein